MGLKRCWCRWVGGAAACVLAVSLVAGCGEEKPPVNPPANPPANAPAKAPEGDGKGAMPAMPAAEKVYACPKCGMTAKEPGDCPHCKVPMVEKPAKPEGAGAMMSAPANAAKVFACTHCNKVSPTAGDCPSCKMKMSEMVVSNPDPKVCPDSGEEIGAKPAYSIINGKVFAFCCIDCEGDFKTNFDARMKAATEKAAKTQ